jgi:hypothetical protein
MATISQDFEVGTPGNSVSTSDSVDGNSTQFNNVTIGTGAVFAYSNTQAAHGSQSVTISTGATSAVAYAYYNLSVLGSPAKSWFRIYVYIPSSTWGAGRNTRIGGVYNGGTQGVALLVTSARKVQISDATTAVMGISTGTVPLDQWFRVEGYCVTSATVGQGEVKLFTTSLDASSPDETVT